MAAAAVIWGTIWPLSKILKGLTLREGFMEAWYMQLVMLPVRRKQNVE